MRLYNYLKTYANLTKSTLYALNEAGRITVNDKITNLSHIVRDGEVVKLDGKVIEKLPFIYLAYNKPKGYICTNADKPNSLINHLGFSERVFCVGRLDKDTEGLIILTNDCELSDKVLRKENQIKKVYEVLVKEIIEKDKIALLEESIIIKGKPTIPAKVLSINKNMVRLEIYEGKYHQVKSIISSAGLHLTSLKRVKIGKLELGSLKEDEYKNISVDDIF